MTQTRVTTCDKCGVVYADRVYQENNDLMPCPLCYTGWDMKNRLAVEFKDTHTDRKSVTELTELIKDLHERIDDLEEELT